MYVCGAGEVYQKTAFGNQFPPSSVWVPEIILGLSTWQEALLPTEAPCSPLEVHFKFNFNSLILK